jgi:glutamate-ammonia-ligase adenylyltransferase
MTLLSHFSPDGGGLPLPADAHRHSLGIAAWNEALDASPDTPERQRARSWSATVCGNRLLGAIFGNSPFLSGVAVAEWMFLTQLAEDGLDRPFDEILADIEKPEDRGENQAALMRCLRIAKRRIALLTAIGDITGRWSLDRQMAALSRFAEAAIGSAVRHLLRLAAAAGRFKLSDPADPERNSGLIVLGLGKLGGGELNYSSDIDLILLFDPPQATLGGGDGAHGFYTRLARDLVRILDERTGDGYVFRTDLRLRPDPRSTPLAMSVAAALTYYESVGQNWERAALIKARPVAGDRAAGNRFLAALQPFIWRRHLDFAAIADIHSIKRQIQAHRGGGQIAVAGHDIKIGRGGIREIEFFAQTQQLIWGGRQRELRTATTCEALRRLATAGHIETATADVLIKNYRFLRRVEHHLQMIDDFQTHRLPTDPAGIAHLAIFLGYYGPEAFVTELRGHLGSVETHYAGLFEEAPSLAEPGNLVFTGTEDDPETLATLTRLGFAEPPRVAAMVRSWHHGRMRATRSQRAREILTELIPELLRIFGATAQPDEGLRRFDQFLSQLAAGVQLFSLFHANPGLLALVADIMAAAPLMAEHLAQRPALLDAVLSAGFSAPLPDREALAADLANLLGGARDFEDQLDLVRRWANERRFQVGVQLLRRGLDGEGAGHALSDIAETTLSALLPRTIGEFARTHGAVAGGAFAIVAMGRLGSREMTLASDVDLILIYDAPAEVEASDGERPLPVPAYYARLSQRLIGAITAPTAEGRLYEVDMRLRPSGASGPIASSLEAFAQYQHDAAWTWERMALTRARPVAGDPSLCRRIDDATRAALTAPRDEAGLLADVADMRKRLAEANPRPSPWDLRNRRGGLVDLEFLVQYLVLREASKAPRVLQRESGKSLATLGKLGALRPRAVQELGDSLQLLRHVRALLALLVAEIPTAEELAGPTGESLARCAGAVDFAHLDVDISSACARVSFWYDRIVTRPARRAAQKPENATGDAVQ